MLCARAALVARTHFPSITPLRHSSAAFRRRSSTIRMSSSTPSPNQIIEHIVLIKVKPSAEPSAVSAMLSNLNSLISLDCVLHLSAGPVSICRSKSLTFTHMLHSRYKSKPDLATYTDHPDHVSVVANYVKPVLDDVMAVDWVADDFSGPIEIPPGSVARFTVLKLKDEGGIAKEEVLGVLRGVKEKFPSIEQLTVGENFSPGRAKGYSIASVGIFKGVKELEGLDPEMANQEKDKVRELLDGVLVLDFPVHAAVQAASL